jgi:hypothetical protein
MKPFIMPKNRLFLKSTSDYPAGAGGGYCFASALVSSSGFLAATGSSFISS